MGERSSQEEVPRWSYTTDARVTRSQKAACVGTVGVGAVLAIAQSALAADGASSTKDTVEVVGATIAGILALVGLPTAVLTFRKTQVEIRKLELEARQLDSASPARGTSTDATGYRIAVHDSHDINISILADPRFLGPLLLLLDFIVAWIVLTFAGYAVSVLDLGILDDFLLALFGVVLLLPILREARRVKRRLELPAEPEHNASS